MRVGLLLPTLHYGGAERWSLDLSRSCDPSRVSWTGCVVIHAQNSDEWMLGAMAAMMPVHNAGVTSSRVCGALQEHAEDLRSATHRLLGSADIVVTWEVDERARRLLDHLDSKIVQVAHRNDPASLGRFTRDSDRYVAVWWTCAGVFGANVSRPTEVIPNGIDLNRAAPASNPSALRESWGCTERTLVVGYLGRIDPQKNLPALARAVTAMGSDALGVVIGSRSAGAEDVIAELHQQGRVRVLPGVNDVGTTLAAFDVFFFPSRAEVLSLSLLEAWAARRPVVATRVGAVPDLELRAGPLVVPIAPDADGDTLATAVRTATSESRAVKDMRERAATLVWNEFGLGRMGIAWTNYLVATAESSCRTEER